MDAAHKCMALKKLHIAFIFFLKSFSHSENPDLIA